MHTCSMTPPCLSTRFVFHPIYIFSSPFVSFAPAIIVVTQIRGHTAASPPPCAQRFVPRVFICEKTSALSSLVDSRYRTMLVCACSFVCVFVFPSDV